MRTSFTYTETDKVIYCRRCGQVAGEPTKRPGYSGHDFASTTVPLVCARCGAMIGHSSKCPGYSIHDFCRIK